MTVNVCTIGSNGGPLDDGDVSAWVKKIILIREDFKVGQALITLDNDGNQCGTDFTANEVFEVKLGALGAEVSLMKGRIDDPLDRGLPFSRRPEELLILGRTYAREEVNYFWGNGYNVGNYSAGTTRIDDQIAAAIVGSGTNITYTSASSLPYAPYVWDRTFLQTGICDLCGLADPNCLSYVNDSLALQLFSVDSPPSTGVDVKSVADAEDNNVLDVEVGKGRGSGIANYIHVKGPLVSDHWTEGNKDDWAGMTGCTLTDESTWVLYGANSIKVTRSTSGVYGLELVFPKYNYTVLNFAGLSDGSIKYSANPKDITFDPYVFFKLRPRLTDTSNNVIEYYEKDKTDALPILVWSEVACPVSEYLEIKSSATSGFWHYVTGSTFNWNLVDTVAFITPSSFAAGSFYFDGMKLPFHTLGIADEGAPYGNHGKRMLPLTKLEVRSQAELNTYAASQLNTLKNPFYDLYAKLVGNTSLHYTGTTVTANIPSKNVAASTVFRIAKLQHSFGDAVDPQCDYVTEIWTVKQEA